MTVEYKLRRIFRDFTGAIVSIVIKIINCRRYYYYNCCNVFYDVLVAMEFELGCRLAAD